MTRFFDALSQQLDGLARRRGRTTRSRLYRCVCGQPVFFDNTECLNCHAQLGYEPHLGRVVALAEGPQPGSWRLAGRQRSRMYRRCANFDTPAVCNWLVPAGARETLCPACALNRTIPNLSDPENGRLWAKVESAKRRLVAQLLALGLPLRRAAEPGDGGLMFDLLAPDPDGQPPMTGHDRGLITLNVQEADDAYRVKVREQMHEPYRTLLGHFRHEIGHFYWDRLVAGTPWLDSFRQVFGDERADYGAALQRHYDQGPPADWDQSYISSYASCHPWEDWAETWAHYLHMMDTLETAMSFGVARDAVERPYAPFTETALYDPTDPDGPQFLALVNAWVDLTGVLNELSRSMGQRDFYPFVLPMAVVGKLQFVHRLVRTAPA
ncbi:zinc-binding metallopeptidase family protein [Bordetella sp. 2513F-2]